MNTRKYPRTMQEAFGPHTDNVLYEPKEIRWKPVNIAFAVVYALALITLALVVL